nr:MAG TPA: DNA polymerase [Caudoviricetes sp.]
MDFVQVRHKEKQKNVGGARQTIIEVFPAFAVLPSRDLMVRGKEFFAIWDEESGFWSTDEYRARELIDRELYAYADTLTAPEDGYISVHSLQDFSSQAWSSWRRYLGSLPDHFHDLDGELTWATDERKRENYATRALSYTVAPEETPSYDLLVQRLYTSEEREKFEWAIGAIVAGEARHIQKFLVFYGQAGTGKSTIINLIEELFQGYVATFEAKALGANGQAFATEVFKNNPLVGIQHDGDLSRIEDNTKLNSIVGHDVMTLNEKFKSPRDIKLRAFLFMGTNRPVKITDAKSGIIRRLIDVHPTGKRLSVAEYHQAVARLPFELGGIAAHCLEVFRRLGKDYYSDYVPMAMIEQTDPFFDYVRSYSDQILEMDDGLTLKQAYDWYKEYVDETGLQFKMPRFRFQEELKEYFGDFRERALGRDDRRRNVYYDFSVEKLERRHGKTSAPRKLVLDSRVSGLSDICGLVPAQYASSAGTPAKRWSEVTTKLVDIDERELHYLQPGENHIVIDFDLKNERGEKDRDLNLAAAAKWPATYAEYSQGGNGIHLHYIYHGDSSKLAQDYEPGIEVKVFRGNSSLRRRFSYSNGLPIAPISGGLPERKQKVIRNDIVTNERTMRALIEKALRKEVHSATKPNIDFIEKILTEAYNSGVEYDLSSLESDVIMFAASSSNHSKECMERAMKFPYKSEHDEGSDPPTDDPIVFYDVEVFPNLFVVVWEREDSDQAVTMINPTPSEIEPLLRMRLVGFNNRKYDNHILYARYLGYDNERLYRLSQRIVTNEKGGYFREAFGLSYCDIYDFSSLKQSLKRFELDLGIHHLELGLPWDEPVPEDMWEKVAAYCINDVKATKAVFYARSADFKARKILAALSGLSVNDPTAKHTAKILFNGDPKANEKFVYTDLSKQFPGYEYRFGKSTYRGITTGEGGLVLADPGVYYDVEVFDVASMHPTSIEQLNLFGPYTKNYSDIKEARLAIKHRELDKARTLLGGALAPFLDDEDGLDDLAYALKIVINIVYGLTAAHFDNPFRDSRNKDNIVAKRGALFMVDLVKALDERGVHVLHVKTDSIKVAKPSQETRDFIFEFGKKYGYEFEVEDTFQRLCLVNDAVYIALDHDGKWHATGAQFADPYVFKTLFSKEPLEFEDVTIKKTVTTSIHMNTGTDEEPEMRYIGRSGAFVPVVQGGGTLWREKDGKFSALAGTKGYCFVEAETMKEVGLDGPIDYSYFRALSDKARDTIAKWCDPSAFCGSDN